MSKPKHEDDVTQVATWVPKDLKADLDKRAADEKKPARTVVTEALTAHLRAKTERQTKKGS